MLLAFIIVLLSIGMGILLSMYSIFFPFFENISDISDYNIAYYGALSSIERGMLITKYQSPGFVGSGGRRGNTIVGPNSDFKNNLLGRLENDTNNMIWSINSRTTKIPVDGMGDIDKLLITGDSINFNKLYHGESKVFSLTKDLTDNPIDFYRNDGNVENINSVGFFVKGKFRLPIFVYEKFGGNNNALLCDLTSIPYCDNSGDNLSDEIALNRNIIGKYNNTNGDFRIIPNTVVFYYTNPAFVNILYDNNIRENIINYSTVNNVENIFISNTNNSYSIISDALYNPYLLSKHNLISQDEILLQNMTFNNIISNSNNVSIQFDLISQLISRGNKIYPYIEYGLEFSEEIADINYNIIGNSRVGLYDVSIMIAKPTYKSNLVGNFTIIF